MWHLAVANHQGVEERRPIVGLGSTEQQEGPEVGAGYHKPSRWLSAQKSDRKAMRTRVAGSAVPVL